VTGGGTITPVNLRVDSPVASVATVNYGVDAAGCTDPNSGTYYEFFRAGHPSDPDAATGHSPVYVWSAKNGGPLPMVVDGGSIVVYVGGTTGTGYITAIWAELPENSIT